MRIDPKVEEPTRDLFGHALRAEHEDFQKRLASVDGETVSEAMTLAGTIVAYVCIDACGGQQPTEEEFDTLTDNVVSADSEYSLTAQEVRDYLVKGVFGGQVLHEVLDPKDAVRFPFIVGAYLLAGYSHDDQAWWDYLDEVEAAIEAAPDPE
ncbi:MAG TPA: hypothetical protein VF053_11625 [Streptosporangiales bacterium]